MVDLLALKGVPYDEVRRLYDAVLAGSRVTYGEADTRTLSVMSSLAYYLSKKGSSDEVVLLYREALEGQLAALGSAHPDTLSTLTGLASVYRQRGLLAEARVAYEDLLCGYAEAFAGDGLRSADRRRAKLKHLDGTHNLGVVLHGLGELAEAEARFAEAAEGYQEVYGGGCQEAAQSLEALQIVRKQIMGKGGAPAFARGGLGGGGSGR